MNFHMILISYLRFVEVKRLKSFTALFNNTLFFKFKIVTRIENKNKNKITTQKLQSIVFAQKIIQHRQEAEKQQKIL